MNFTITSATTDDCKPVPELMKGLKGWLFGGKGYIGEEFMEKLKTQAVEIFTKVQKNMKQKPMESVQRSLLRKRGLVETVIDQLKNVCQIEHTRHHMRYRWLI